MLSTQYKCTSNKIPFFIQYYWKFGRLQERVSRWLHWHCRNLFRDTRNCCIAMQALISLLLLRSFREQNPNQLQINDAAEQIHTDVYIHICLPFAFVKQYTVKIHTFLRCKHCMQNNCFKINQFCAAKLCWISHTNNHWLYI